MKKRVISLLMATVLTSALVLSGCGDNKGASDNASISVTDDGNGGSDKLDTNNKKGAYDENNIAPETGYVALSVHENSDVVALDDATTKATREAIGLNDAAIANIKGIERGKYSFDSLDAETQTVYVELLTIVNNHATDVMVSTKDADKLQLAFQCMFNEHPEIFWIDGYSFTRHTKNGEVIYLSFSGEYTYNQSQCAAFQGQIDAYVNKCLAGISATASDYDKVKYVYEYLINNTDYVLSAPDNQNILSVFINGKSVCQGYAKATQYLLQKLGVPCSMVVGSVISGEGHAWNLVNIGGSFYYVDTTWGDANYSLNGQSVDMGVNYDFLNITTQELEKTHRIRNAVTMPVCIATTANYYIMEGLYFDKYDAKKVGTAFNNAYAKGYKTITFKCANVQAYNQMISALLDEQRIFDYIRIDTVTYATSDKDLTFTIWL